MYISLAILDIFSLTFHPGILESISPTLRENVVLTAMCFPTPRDPRTDRAGSLFDGHINISPDDK